jgi:hypothetical protein
VLGTAVSFEQAPPSAHEIAERMRSGLPWLVAEDAGAEGMLLRWREGAPKEQPRSSKQKEEWFA